MWSKLQLPHSVTPPAATLLLLSSRRRRPVFSRKEKYRREKHRRVHPSTASRSEAGALDAELPAGGSGFTMKWLQKMVAPMQKIWIIIAKRVGIRKTGLVKLRQDVRTCEYDDVHVLWDMLKRNETKLTSLRTKRRRFWNICNWARRAPYLCRSF